VGTSCYNYIKTKNFNSDFFSEKQIKILIELENLLITIKEKYINKKKLKDQDRIIKNINKAENLINLYKRNQKMPIENLLCENNSYSSLSR